MGKGKGGGGGGGGGAQNEVSENLSLLQDFSFPLRSFLSFPFLSLFNPFYFVSLDNIYISVPSAQTHAMYCIVCVCRLEHWTVQCCFEYMSVYSCYKYYVRIC